MNNLFFLINFIGKTSCNELLVCYFVLFYLSIIINQGNVLKLIVKQKKDALKQS